MNLDTLTNNNPFLIVAIGDFNAKTTNCYQNDTTSYKGLKNDAITFQFGLRQLIDEPTHPTGNSSSCIELIFTSVKTYGIAQNYAETVPLHKISTPGN